MSIYDDNMVPSEYQSPHDIYSADIHTLYHESNYTKSEPHDESSLNDLCDSSTYGIAEEFYYDLECFITNHNDDTVTKASLGVIEFELLSHDLLHHHNHHLNSSAEDHQHLSDNFDYKE